MMMHINLMGFTNRLNLSSPVFYLYLLTLLLVVAYSAFIVYNLVYWRKVGYQRKEALHKATKVSIIIPARNEEKNIAKCLASVLNQDYGREDMEIIVCDDQSEDHTRDVAKRILSGSNVKNTILEAENQVSNKKSAIESGIRAATGDLIILTDADCVAGNTWVSALVKAYVPQVTTMLCGPVAIIGEASLCDKFQSLEQCGLSLLTGAGIAAGIPLLCNGANMAYSREAFYAAGGFNGINDIPTGDDTLLLFKMNKKFPGTIRYIKSKEAMVFTGAQPGWSAFFQQRIRWASKGFRGGNYLNTAVGLLVFLSDLLLIISGFYLFFNTLYLPVFLLSIFLKSAIDFLLLTYAAKFFDKKNLLTVFLIAEPITIIYTSLVGFAAFVIPYTWKGRKYKVSRSGISKK